MPPRKSAKSTAAAKDAEVDKNEEQKQTRRSTRSQAPKKEDPIEEEEDEEVETPKNKRGAAKKTAKETKAPAAKKGASKIAAKVSGKKGKKDESEEEEESEEEKPKKAPAKRGRKSKKDEESEEEEEVKKPAVKSPAKRGRKSTKKKEESEEEEDESEEEVVKPTKRGGRRSASAKQDKEEEEDSKAKTARGKRGARGKSLNKDNEEVEDEKEKKQQKTGETGVSSTVVDSEVEMNTGVKVFKKPGWIYDRYIEEEDNNDPNVKKFFKIQVLEALYSKYPNHFYTYVRWGKVGEKGEWTLRGFFNKNRACQIYDEKIAEKMKYIKLNAAKKGEKAKSAEASQTMQTETPAQSQSQVQPDSSQNNASTQDTTQQQNGTVSQENPTTTEAPKTAIEEEKNGASAANPVATEEKKPEEAQPMEVEKEGKTEEENNKMEEIKEEAAKIDKAKIDCPVDTHCPLASTTEVYIKDNEIFDTKYNASDVKKNTNHFYLFQILRNKKEPSKFYVFYRYGRVGLPGEWVLRGVFTEEQAVAQFRAKQEEKKVQNKYTALEMSYMKDDPELLTKLFSEGASKSKLKKPVAEFIQLIFDFKMMNAQMEKAGYDPKKLPLGKLSLNMINKGFSLLSELSDAIKNNADNEKIQKLCSDFFTVIPQNVGWQNMNTLVIRTNEQIKEKLEFLDSLRQIQAAYQMVHGGGEKIDEGTNAIDENYEKLKCDIEPVDPSSEEYKKISTFIDNTKENYQVEIMEMFKINKHRSEEVFRKDLDNHVMLWHGSRLTNFVGILSQGLRIAPPEAPVSGYRLGKGIYLADMISKSVPYCYASASNDTFCIMVCDAALGNINEKMHDDFYAGNLPADKHSTKALGHVAPPVSSYEDFEPGVKIPQGKPEKTEHSRSSFQHNEFIVYNVNQVQIRYLLKMKQKRRGGLFG